jgi:cell division protein FtsN
MMNTNQQRGGMILGIIVGVLVGLGVALAVAVYVMKVPTPFNSKSTSRTPAQDAAEAKKNKDWDPNAALSGKPAVKADAAPHAKPATALPTPAPAVATPATPQTAPQTPSQAPRPQATPTIGSQPTTAPAAATASPAASTGEIEYFVQVAAFNNEAEAQAMRGKLALSGFEGRIVERDQSGRTVYRVRTGPYNQAGGDKAKASLEAAGFETVLVRSQK